MTLRLPCGTRCPTDHRSVARSRLRERGGPLPPPLRGSPLHGTRPAWPPPTVRVHDATTPLEYLADVSGREQPADGFLHYPAPAFRRKSGSAPLTRRSQVSTMIPGAPH